MELGSPGECLRQPRWKDECVGATIDQELSELGQLKKCLTVQEFWSKESDSSTTLLFWPEFFRLGSSTNKGNSGGECLVKVVTVLC